MYAVFRTGGKQYRASKGDTLKVEKLNAAEGDKVEFAEVLLVGEGASVKIGNPLVAGSKVQALVLNQAKDKKIEVIKFKRRQNYRRNRGHRQGFTLLEITGIASDVKRKVGTQPTLGAASKTKKAAAKKATTKKVATKKAATKKAEGKKTTAKKTATKLAGKVIKE